VTVETRVHFGDGALSALPGVLASCRARRVLLVCGQGSYESSGARQAVEELLDGLQVARFSGFSANPKLEDVERGIRMVRQEEPDTVLAIGGGTAMDIAKTVAVLADEEGEPRDYVERLRPLGGRRRRSLVLVPTTAGTGSEVTCFGVIYVDRVKHSLDHPCLAADAALVDPQLTRSMPPRLTAVTGLDTLSQAVESYWSLRSTAESRAWAAQALRLVLEHHEDACLRPTPAARTGMARAALLAGRAINVTRTTAPHAVSYPMTGLYDVPHGHACALTLPRFFLYNAAVSEADCLDPRGAEFIRQRMAELLALLAAGSPAEACAGIEDRMRRCGLETRLSELGLDGAARERIVDLGFNPDRVGNNPRRLDPAGLRAILESIR
jgi:alcohol dehydrogenase class IV